MKAAMFSMLICLREYSDHYIIKTDFADTRVVRIVRSFFYSAVYVERATEKGPTKKIK
jgi:hypothetical protein